MLHLHNIIMKLKSSKPRRKCEPDCREIIHKAPPGEDLMILY